MESTNQEQALLLPGCVICISSHGEILKSFICLMALTSITCTDNICLSNPRHPEGAFTPTRSGSARRFRERFLRWSGVYTSACSFTLSKPHFAALGLWSINTDQSALPIPVGPAEKSLCERSLPGARIGPAAEAWQTRGGVNSTTQFLQTYPLRSPCIPWICYERSYSEF